MKLNTMTEHIADYIINRLNDNEKEITNKKLQKLLYFCEAKYMTDNNGESMYPDNQMFPNEKFLAWGKGPVLLDVYNTYLNRDIFLENRRSLRAIHTTKDNIEKLPPNIKNTIDIVTEKLWDYSIVKLIEATHFEGGPWYEAYYAEENKDLKILIDDVEISFITIDKKKIYDYYRSKSIDKYVHNN